MKLNNIQYYLTRPINPLIIAAFRILFGLAIMVHVFVFYPPDEIKRLFVDRQFFYSFSLFEFLGLKPWPENMMYLHFLVMGFAGIGIAFGLFYRLSLATFFTTFLYVFLIEKTYYNNHYYLMLLITFLLFFINANCSLSIDALLKPKIRKQTLPFWNLFILRAQICIVYFYAGIAKIYPDWLSGRVFNYWIHDNVHLGKIGHYPIIGDWFTHHWAIYLVTYGAMFFDLTVAFFLCYRPTRIAAIWIALIFHLANQWFFGFGNFHFLMIATLILFANPQQIKKIAIKISKLFTFAANAQNSPEEKPIKNAPLFFIGFYLFLQIVIPIRHLVYPGNLNWTYEGYRFSWRLIANRYVNEIQFYIDGKNLPESQIIILPNDMPREPDMIIQYAHYLRDQLKKQGATDIKIYADAKVSLNQRPYAPLISPDVNLADINYPPLSHASWILPYPDDKKALIKK